MAKRKQMSKSDIKFTKTLFLIISVILVLFLGCGIYFMKSSAMGAGFLGIGIFVLGLGIMGLFAEGILYESVDGPAAGETGRVKKKTNVSDVENPEFQMDAQVGYYESDDSPRNGVVYLCSDRMYIKHLEDDNVQILYSDIRDIKQDKNKVVVVGMFNISSHLKNDSIYVTAESVIKVKAFMQIFDDKLRKYNSRVLQNLKSEKAGGQ